MDGALRVWRSLVVHAVLAQVHCHEASPWHDEDHDTPPIPHHRQRGAVTWASLRQATGRFRPRLSARVPERLSERMRSKGELRCPLPFPLL